MYISRETPEQTETRLLKVIATADFKIMKGPYVFEEFPAGRFGDAASADALAYVRDEDVWSRLVPAPDESGELFALAGFHFSPGLDNSGFVGWLASHLKQKLGTGVFVVCGQNSAKGGIFDYWGCPYALKDEFFREIMELIEKGKTN